MGRPYNVLFLCTGNSARSIMAEAIIDRLGAGIVLGRLSPGAFHALAAAEVARVNLPVAVLVWLMIVPMLLKIDMLSVMATVNRGRSWYERGLAPASALAATQRLP